jgi:hypothetical protein
MTKSRPTPLSCSLHSTIEVLPIGRRTERGWERYVIVAGPSCTRFGGDDLTDTSHALIEGRRGCLLDEFFGTAKQRPRGRPEAL